MMTSSTSRIQRTDLQVVTRSSEEDLLLGLALLRFGSCDVTQGIVSVRDVLDLNSSKGETRHDGEGEGGWKTVILTHLLLFSS
jgi:hypothetical protein